MQTDFCLIELVEDSSLSLQLISDEKACQKLNALRSQAEKSALPYFKLSAADSLPDISAFRFVLLCGQSSKNKIYEYCRRLRSIGLWVLLVTDALCWQEDLLSLFEQLEAEMFQLAKTAGVISMLANGNRFVFPFAKPDCSATVCLLFDSAQTALVIERLVEPYKGRLAFPGGFLKVQLESMEDCALRELKEECSINLSAGELRMVDLRSCPERDPRTHVIDAGYAALISPGRKSELVAQLKSGDDAENAHLHAVSDLLLEGRLAFDHRELLLSALKQFGA